MVEKSWSLITIWLFFPKSKFNPNGRLDETRKLGGALKLKRISIPATTQMQCNGKR